MAGMCPPEHSTIRSTRNWIWGTWGAILTITLMSLIANLAGLKRSRASSADNSKPRPLAPGLLFCQNTMSLFTHDRE